MTPRAQAAWTYLAFLGGLLSRPVPDGLPVVDGLPALDWLFFPLATVFSFQFKRCGNVSAVSLRNQTTSRRGASFRRALTAPRAPNRG